MKLKAATGSKVRYSGVRKYAQQKKEIDSRIAAFIADTFKGFIQADNFGWVNTDDSETLVPCGLNEKGVANLTRLNDIRNINTFLEAANANLKNGEYLVACAETKNSRRERIFNKFPRYISLPYYMLDFILKRVFPKWRPTHKIYYAITKGRNRVLTSTETLGRLYACGFKVISHRKIGYNTYYIAKKVKEPVYTTSPYYGSLIRLNRVGYRNKMITVFKLRTMHPYSEYIQDYLYELNDLQKGGKIKNDFRVTNWGRVFRKLWIDELPMIWNLLKGEIKLVGVRPLSPHYFSLYTKEMQELRTSVKPGLVPPFYMDMPQSFEEIMESERRYIEAYKKYPVRTDIRYFFISMNNILVKRVRSA